MSQESHESHEWYVVHTYSGFEKRVQQLLEDKVQKSFLGDEISEILIPTVDERVDSKKVIKKKTFPGYILVRMRMTTDNWHVVKNIPKVTGFVGGREPFSIPEKDVKSMLDLAKSDAPRLASTYVSGDAIEVTDGPFMGYSGVVEEVNAEREKVRVTVKIFGRDTSVELGYFQIKISAAN